MKRKELKKAVRKLSSVLVLLAITAVLIAVNVVTAEEYTGEPEDCSVDTAEQMADDSIPENKETGNTLPDESDQENEDSGDAETENTESDYIEPYITAPEETGTEDTEPVNNDIGNDDPEIIGPEISLPEETISESDEPEDYNEEPEQENSEENTENPADDQTETEQDKDIKGSVYEIEGVDHDAHVGVNLASMRLIVGTGNRNIFVDESVIISGYDGIYILQFKDLETTMLAYDYYCLVADFVEADTGISIAEGEAAETVITETVMTVDENPLSELEDAVNESADISGMHFDIALIDTGADGADYSVSMLGDDPEDHNGHGTKMLEYIREQNPDAKVLSIKALGNNGTGTVSAVYAAMEYAISCNVSIINLSVSAMASPDSHIIEEAVIEARAKGITVVGAAGNNGKDASGYVPGGIAFAMIIGAADESGQRRDISNYGATVDYNVVAETTSEAAARFSGFVSRYGIDEVFSSLNNGFIFLCEYNLNWESEAGNIEENMDEEEPGDDFGTAGALSYWNWYTGGTKANNLPTIKEWLNSHPGGKLVDIVNYIEPIVTTNGMKSSIYLHDGTPLKYVNYKTGSDQYYSNVYWTVSDPDSGYTYKMTLERISCVDPYNTDGLRFGSNLAFGVTGEGWFYCERFYNDPYASSVYSYFTQPKVVNSVIREGIISPMVTYAWINIKVYRTDDPSAPLNLPYLFIGWADIDAGQYCRNNSESFNEKEIFKSAKTWEYDYSHGSGYDMYINKANNCIYANGCFGLKGAIIYQETDQHIYEGNGLNSTWGWTSNAGSNVRLITVAYPVTYKASDGGRIIGITSEDVIHGRLSAGSEAAADEGYILSGWEADTDIQLNDGTVVNKGDRMDNDQIADAVITAPVNFTAFFEPAAGPVIMPQAGGEGIGIMMAGGLSCLITCIMAYFAARRCFNRG